MTQSTQKYAVPKGEARAELTVKRSRFIACIRRAPDADAASAYVDALRAEYPDATHHCWAYIAGPPGNTGCVGMSDDGEPHGTAGRPMLNILSHSEIGEIVTVVVRYFGGTKLGTGGLVRAYSGVLKAALEQLQTEEKRVLVTLRIEAPFQDDSRLRRHFETADVDIVSATYGTGVQFELAVDAELVDELTTEISGMTCGRANVLGQPE